ncbi:MAG: hypothetical protein ACTSUE_22700, partial [Promethearchaeota archaeon]
MLEGKNLKEPLMLHFLFVKRQPFIISGFLDAGEFNVLKDYVSECTIHESIHVDGFDDDFDDEGEFLLQLYDSESEDLIEGKKNVTLVRQVKKKDLDVLVSKFEKGWVVSTTTPAQELARCHEIPVFDLKSLEWVNYDESSVDLSQERSLLDSAEGLALRISLKAIYQLSVQTAMLMVTGEEDKKLQEHLKACERLASKKMVLDMVSSYFGLATEDIEDFSQGIPEGPSEEEKAIDEMDKIAGRMQRTRGTVKSEGGRQATLPVHGLHRDSRAVNAASGSVESEFSFLSQNLIFKKQFVKLLDKLDVGGCGDFTSPLKKYACLRESVWQESIPEDFLEE